MEKMDATLRGLFQLTLSHDMPPKSLIVVGATRVETMDILDTLDIFPPSGRARSPLLIFNL